MGDLPARELSATEKFVMDAVSRGITCDGGAANDIGLPSVLDADFVGRIIRNVPQHAGLQTALAFENWVIRGVVDLRDIHVAAALRFGQCRMRDLDMTGARLKSVVFDDCVLGRVQCRHSAVTGDFVVTNSSVDSMRCTDGVVAGSLVLRNSRVGSGESEHALVMDRVKIGGGLFAGGLRTLGVCRLLGADIKGQLELIGSRLDGCGGASFSIDGGAVGDGVFARGGEFIGPWRGPGLRVDGAVDMTDARFFAATDAALSLMRATVETDVSLARAESFGTIDLSGATIQQDLRFFGSKLSTPGGVAVKAPGVRIGGEIAGQRARISGGLVFGSASIAGSVRLDAVRLAGVGDDAAAMTFSQADCKRNIVISRGRIRGRVNLSSCTTNGAIVAIEAFISDFNRVAVDLDGARAESGVIFRGAQVLGSISALRSQTGAAFDLTDALVLRSEANALIADGARVDGDLLMGGLTSFGVIRLLGIEISGDWDAARIQCAGNVIAQGMVARSLSFREGYVNGSVDVGQSKIGSLFVVPHVNMKRLVVEGLRYEKAYPLPSSTSLRDSCRYWEKWLAACQVEQRGVSGAHVADAYRGLAEALQSGGREDEARFVAMLGHRRRRTHAGLGFRAQAVSASVG